MNQLQYQKFFLTFLGLGIILPVGAVPPSTTTSTSSMPQQISYLSASENNMLMECGSKPNPAHFQIKTLSDALNQTYMFSTQILTSVINLKKNLQECFKGRSEWFPQITVGLSGQISPTNGFSTNNVGTVINVQEASYRTQQKNRQIEASFRIAQNLYSGGETMAKNACLLERYRQEFCTFKATIQDAFMDVISKFVDMMCARERYLIFKMREESAAMLREIARNRAMAGDQRMVDVSVANAQSIRISMASNDAMQDYMQRKHELEVITGGVISENCQFPAPLEVDLYKMESFIELCLKGNPKIQAQMHAQKVARLAAKINAASFSPRIDGQCILTGSDQFQYSANSGFTPYPVKTSQTGYTVAISAQMNVFDGGARNAAYRQSELDVKNSRIILEQQRRDVIRACKDTVNIYRLTLQNLVSAKEAQKEQAAAFAAARQEYALGATTLVDLLGLEEQYVGILNALVQAQGQLIKLSYQLKALAGKLTENALRIPCKRYDIEKYRKGYPLPMFTLCPGEMTTDLYEVPVPKGYVVGSEMKLDTFNALAQLEPGLRETSVPWYPKDGFAFQEEPRVSVENAENAFDSLLKSYSGISSNGMEDHDLETMVRLAKLVDATNQESSSPAAVKTEKSKAVPAKAGNTVGSGTEKTMDAGLTKAVVDRPIPDPKPSESTTRSPNIESL